MTSLVVDSSIVVYVLTEASNDDVLRQRLSEPRILSAPALIDYEVASTLRGLVLGRKLPVGDADAVRADFADMKIVRFPGPITANRTWELRHNFTSYDASFIALAELLDCPLLTGDQKLKGKHRADVEVYPAG